MQLQFDSRATVLTSLCVESLERDVIIQLCVTHFLPVASHLRQSPATVARPSLATRARSCVCLFCLIQFERLSSLERLKEMRFSSQIFLVRLKLAVTSSCKLSFTHTTSLQCVSTCKNFVLVPICNMTS